MLTSSKSCLVRKRFSRVFVSSNLNPWTHSPGWDWAACWRIASLMADMDGREQSAAITWRMPLLNTWMRASINPGRTVLPLRSSSLVPGPANVAISLLFPTAMNLPWRMAKACARGWLGLRVMMLALRMMVSAWAVESGMLASHFPLAVTNLIWPSDRW